MEGGTTSQEGTSAAVAAADATDTIDTGVEVFPHSALAQELESSLLCTRVHVTRLRLPTCYTHPAVHL